MIRIIVDSEAEKSNLLKASRMIHDCRSLNSNHSGINTLMHLHMCPDIIKVSIELNTQEEDHAI